MVFTVQDFLIAKTNIIFYYSPLLSGNQDKMQKKQETENGFLLLAHENLFFVIQSFIGSFNGESILNINNLEQI